MNNVTMLRPNELSQLSELAGGRKVRDFVYYHIRPYAAAGQTVLNFFRVNGLQEDLSGGIGVFNASNMVTSGKFDEPFLIQRIGLFYDNGSAVTLANGGYAKETIDTLRSGKLELEINNKVVYERAPLGLVGQVDAFDASFGSTATLLAFASSKLAPAGLDPMIFVEEGVTVQVNLRWTTVVTNTAAASIGVYMFGLRYEKA